MMALLNWYYSRLSNDVVLISDQLDHFEKHLPQPSGDASLNRHNDDLRQISRSVLSKYCALYTLGKSNMALSRGFLVEQFLIADWPLASFLSWNENSKLEKKYQIFDTH